MVKEDKSKNSTLISLALHIGVIIVLCIFSKPITLLVPSRSDGMEVSLVSMPNQTVRTYQPQIKAAPATIKTLAVPAEVNLKQDLAPIKAPPKPTPLPSPEPSIAPPDPKENNIAPAPTNSKAQAKKKQKVQVNDLLGDMLSDNTTAIRKGKALGGNPNGTSDSDNLIGNYADQVINAVQPFILVPDDISPNAKAIVKVILNPDLSVRQVTLLQASGNSLYDENVQSAINRVKIFPPLPDGAKYVDYRILKLTFRPE